MEKFALSGDDSKLLSGLVERKNQVELELENTRARCLAIVSIDGGPSKVSLDMIYTFLKDSMQYESSAYNDDEEEMEEVVSNAIQNKHKFVVDILLQMVLLEEELESLLEQIKNFTAISSSSSSPQEEKKISSQEDENENENENNINADTKILRELIKSQQESAKLLEENLLTSQLNRKKLLQERLEKKKLQRISELTSSGTSSCFYYYFLLFLFFKLFFINYIT